MPISLTSAPQRSNLALRPQEDMGTLEALASGFAVGAGNDPLINAALGVFAPQIQVSLDALEADLAAGGGATGRAAEGVGSLAALILPGFGTYALGRAAAHAAVRAGASAGAKGLLESAAFLTTQTSGRAPLALRAAEIGGGNLAFGGEEFLRAKLTGDENPEALKRATALGGLGVAIEGSLVLAGRTPMLRRLVGAMDDHVAAYAQAPSDLSQQELVGLSTAMAKVFDSMVAKAAKAGVDPMTLGLPADVSQLSVAALDPAVRSLLSSRQVERLRKIEQEVEDLGAGTNFARTRAGVAVTSRQMLKEKNAAFLRYQEAHTAQAEAQGKLAAATTRKAEKKWEAEIKKQTLRMAKAEELGTQKELAALRLSDTTGKAAAKDRVAEQELGGLLGDAPSRLSPTEAADTGLDRLLAGGGRGRDFMGRQGRDAQHPRWTEGVRRGWRMIGGTIMPFPEIRNKLAWTSANFLKNPRAAMEDIGIEGAVGIDKINMAIGDLKGLSTAWTDLTTDFFNRLGSAMHRAHGGKKSDWAVKGHEAPWSSGLLNDYETLGIDDIASKHGPEVGTLMRELEGIFGKAGGALSKMAGTRLQTAEELVEKGILSGRYFPQDVLFGSLDAIQSGRGKLVEAAMKDAKKRGRTLSRAEAETMVDRQIAAIQGSRNGGLKAVGHFDHMRELAGTTAEKKAKLEKWGVASVNDDMMSAMEGYGREWSYKYAFSRHVGPNGEVIDGLVNGLAKRGADAGQVELFRDLTNHFLGRSFYEESSRMLAKTALNLQIITKLGLAPIANMSQSVNPAAAWGIQNFARGIVSPLRELSGGQKSMVGGILREVRESPFTIHQEITAAYRTRPGRAPLDRSAQMFLRANLFSLTEVFNRGVTAKVATATVRDIMYKGAAKRLTGRAWSNARRQMKALDLDLDDIARNNYYNVTMGKNIPAGDLDKLRRLDQVAANAGSREAQFVPDAASLPLMWQTPLGRVMTQFKSFAFNQSRFIKDNILREAVEGNLAPLARVLTLFPMAGSAVNEGLSAFKENPKRSTGLSELVDNFAAVGGFGLAESTFYSLQYNDAASVLLGPTVSDIWQIGRALVVDDTAGQMQQQMEKLPTARLGKAVAGAGAAAWESGFELYQQGLDQSDPAQTSGDLLLRRIQQRVQRTPAESEE